MRKSLQKTRARRIDPIAKCHVKKGDSVVVLSGTEKGKKGKILKVIKKYSKLVVEKVNIKKIKVYDFSKKNKKGRFDFNIVARECPLHVSKVMFYDTENNVASKLSRVMVDGVMKRKVKKTGRIL